MLIFMPYALLMLPEVCYVLFSNKVLILAPGPDSNGAHRIRSIFTSDGIELQLSLFACVLHLRGEHVVDQPHKNDSGDVLCWNGEVN